MRTAYCPKSHTALADVSVGRPFGHVPGHQYHDVAVVISTRRGKYRVHVVESWGAAQGYDEEHGRREVIGRGDSIEDAVRDAAESGREACVGPAYLAEALSRARDVAEETAAKPGPHDVLATVCEGDFRDCTVTGYEWTLYGDGRVAAGWHSRWQGSRDGTRYVTAPGAIDIDDIDDDDPDADAEAALTAFSAGRDPVAESEFRQVRRGHTVR